MQCRECNLIKPSLTRDENQSIYFLLHPKSPSRSSRNNSRILSVKSGIVKEFVPTPGFPISFEFVVYF